MGTTYYDSEGEATFLFGKVPIYAVKKAYFKNKLGTVSQLLKMVYNSVTYDFTETANGGAVIFSNNFTNWEFITSADNFTNSEIYSANLITAMTRIKNKNVPGWEKFAEWIYQNRDAATDFLGSYTAYIRYNDKDYTIDVINLNDMTEPTFYSLMTALFPYINENAAGTLPMKYFHATYSSGSSGGSGGGGGSGSATIPSIIKYTIPIVLKSGESEALSFNITFRE